MLTVFGVGEAAISVSSSPRDEGPLRHTVRDVGSVTHALCSAQIGDLVGVRGPFGTDWGVDAVLPHERRRGGGWRYRPGPLRGAIDELVARGHGRGNPGVRVVGAREPQQIIFGADIDRWTRHGAHTDVTVDFGAPGWPGHVGLVTSLLPGAGFDPARTTALMCGPEIMMRFTARDLIGGGVEPDRIRVSLERNMQCGVGWCGHCQLGPYLLCRDGPVLPYGGPVARLSRRARTMNSWCRPQPWRYGNSRPATAASSACSTVRTSCWRLAGAVRIAHFTEMSRAKVAGPYDLSLVEGSITTAEDVGRIHEVRAQSRPSRHDRGVRHRRRDPGPAQLCRLGRVHRRRSTPTPSTSPLWTPRHPSLPMSRWTSSFTGVRSTAASCSRC